MEKVDVFYQIEGSREILHTEIDAEHTVANLTAILIERHGLDREILIFLEDSDEPLAEVILIREHVGHAGVKIHAHRCKHIEVSVTFNGETVHHHFAPGKTVAKVKHWVAVHKFKMSEAEASEHVLQIAGTHDRPSPGAHIGTLTTRPHCRIAFDLVPDQRVNG